MINAETGTALLAGLFPDAYSSSKKIYLKKIGIQKHLIDSSKIKSTSKEK